MQRFDPDEWISLTQEERKYLLELIEKDVPTLAIKTPTWRMANRLRAAFLQDNT